MCWQDRGVAIDWQDVRVAVNACLSYVGIICRSVGPGNTIIGLLCCRVRASMPTRFMSPVGIDDWECLSVESHDQLDGC